jgi:O-antigen/teichoic acid export membrane protein
MSRTAAAQLLAFAGLVAILAYLVIWSADSWADWVVLGVIALTAFGASLAVYQRQHHGGRKAFSRSSDTPA